MVDEKLKVENEKVKKQEENVRSAEKALEEAKVELKKKRMEEEKLILHKGEWTKEMKVEMAKDAAKEQEEIGQAMYEAQRRKGNH